MSETGIVAIAEMSTEGICIKGMSVYLYAWMCTETERNLPLPYELAHLTAQSSTKEFTSM